MKAFMALHHGGKELGTLHLELYDETVPRTVQNFATLLGRTQPLGYLRSPFHRIVKGFVAQGGDFTNMDGTGGYSIYGPEFEDETFRHRHDRPGCLSMANSGPDTNGSQFFVTFRPLPHLDQKHVVFGHVDFSRSRRVLDMLERVPTDPKTDQPLQAVVIADGGVVESAGSANCNLAQKKHEENRNEEEIDLEGSDDDEEAESGGAKGGNSMNESPAHVMDDTDDDVAKAGADEDDQIGVPATGSTRSAALQLRLRNLKQKMNQARQLNQQEVQREGEKMSRLDTERKKQRAADKQREKATWEARHARALEAAERHGVEGKHLTQQACDSLHKAKTRAERAEVSRHSSRDYHNPEGQALNYQRNLRSLPKQHSLGDEGMTVPAASTTATFNPLDDVSGGTGSSLTDERERERQGARRLAEELHRRIDKQNAAQLEKRVREESEEADGASHINKRNRLFNEKIKRNYDAHTAEIRQNLERGTAL
jgi:cyclophilin family peptidyl-prolyl cis-trans isomerase